MKNKKPRCSGVFVVNDKVLSNKTRDYSEHYNILFTLILIKSHIIHPCTVIQWSYFQAFISLKKKADSQLSAFIKRFTKI